MGTLPWVAGTRDHDVGPVAYVDQVELLIPRGLDPDTFDRLDRACGGRVWSAPTNPRAFRYASHRHRLYVHRPGPEAIRLLARMRAAQLSVAHIALDIPAPSVLAAMERQSFLQAHLLRTGRRRKHRRHLQNGQTIYWYRARKGERAPFDLVLYSDLPSKLTDLPCSHIEVRLNAPRVLRTHGIESVGDLLNFDFRGFFARWLVLVEPDMRRLGREWLRARMETARSPNTRRDLAGLLKSDDRCRRLGSLLLRGAPCRAPTFPLEIEDAAECPIGVQEVADFASEIGVRRSRVRAVFRTLDASPFLPPPTTIERRTARAANTA